MHFMHFMRFKNCICTLCTGDFADEESPAEGRHGVGGDSPAAGQLDSPAEVTVSISDSESDKWRTVTVM